jgi:hypothetical protein
MSGWLFFSFVSAILESSLQFLDRNETNATQILPLAVINTVIILISILISKNLLSTNFSLLVRGDLQRSGQEEM